MARLASQPVGRFEFTFTPTHGSWLNLVEGFFSKLARSVLRHIRVSSKQELKDRRPPRPGPRHAARPAGPSISSKKAKDHSKKCGIIAPRQETYLR
jgi:transposase